MFLLLNSLFHLIRISSHIEWKFAIEIIISKEWRGCWPYYVSFYVMLYVTNTYYVRLVIYCRWNFDLIFRFCSSSISLSRCLLLLSGTHHIVKLFSESFLPFLPRSNDRSYLEHLNQVISTKTATIVANQLILYMIYRVNFSFISYWAIQFSICCGIEVADDDLVNLKMCYQT